MDRPARRSAPDSRKPSGDRRGPTDRPRPVGLVVVVALIFSSGCAGVFGFDGTSDSAGWHARGTLRHPAVLPFEGDGYVVPPPWRTRQSNFGSDELVALIVRVSREVANAYPGSVAAVGDLSRRNGGESIEHKSHQSGRDVDIFYYGMNATGRPEIPRNTMLHYDRAGRAIRWSPPQGVRAPALPLPEIRFDPRRNWRLVRALLRDPDVEVQWIFVQRDLAALLLQEGLLEGDDPAEHLGRDVVGVRGAVVVGRSVARAAHGFDRAIEGARGRPSGLREHEVLEQVGKAGLAGGGVLVAGADTIGGHVAHAGGAVVGDGEDLEPARQPPRADGQASEPGGPQRFGRGRRGVLAHGGSASAGARAGGCAG